MSIQQNHVIKINTSASNLILSKPCNTDLTHIHTLSPTHTSEPHKSSLLLSRKTVIKMKHFTATELVVPFNVKNNHQCRQTSSYSCCLLTSTSNTWGCLYAAMAYRCRVLYSRPCSTTNSNKAHFPCREAGKNIRQVNGLQSELIELTDTSTSGVSVSLVSFTLCGGTSLDCGFSCLFSSRGSIFVPCRGSGATSRFGGSGQSGTMLLFSLNFPRSHLVCPGMGFSITALWADQSKQEEKV